MEGDVDRLQQGDAGFDLVAGDGAFGFEGLDGGVDERQQVQGLEDTAVVGERLAQTGRTPVVLHHPDQVISADLAGDEGAGDARHVLPVGADRAHADAVARHGIARTVGRGSLPRLGGLGLDPPQTGVGDVCDPRGELVAADREQPEHDVGVRGVVGDD
jgi:hypothetical protein